MEPSVVLRACNPSAEEAEAGRLPHLQSQPELHNEILSQKPFRQLYPAHIGLNSSAERAPCIFLGRHSGVCDPSPVWRIVI